MAKYNQPDQPIPVDPMTALSSSAHSMHETFICCLQAGFTEDQALRIIGMIMEIAFKADQGERSIMIDTDYSENPSWKCSACDWTADFADIQAARAHTERHITASERGVVGRKWDA